MIVIRKFYYGDYGESKNGAADISTNKETKN